MTTMLKLHLTFILVDIWLYLYGCLLYYDPWNIVVWGITMSFLWLSCQFSDVITVYDSCHQWRHHSRPITKQQQYTLIIRKNKQFLSSESIITVLHFSIWIRFVISYVHVQNMNASKFCQLEISEGLTKKPQPQINIY